MAETAADRYVACQHRLLELVLDGRYGTPEYQAAIEAARAAWDELDADVQDDFSEAVRRQYELTGEARPLRPGDVTET